MQEYMSSAMPLLASARARGRDRARTDHVSERPPQGETNPSGLDADWDARGSARDIGERNTWQKMNANAGRTLCLGSDVDSGHDARVAFRRATTRS